MSEANGQTQSKDPYHHDADGSKPRNFRIVVRFIDDHGTEIFHEPSRGAAAWERPARQCRVTATHVIESRRNPTHA